MKSALFHKTGQTFFETFFYYKQLDQDKQTMRLVLKVKLPVYIYNLTH